MIENPTTLYAFSKMIEDVISKLIKRGVVRERLLSRTLTPRQIEILAMLAMGKCNKEISSALNISVKTVETHRFGMMRRLNMHSLADLTRFAIRVGIIEP